MFAPISPNVVSAIKQHGREKARDDNGKVVTRTWITCTPVSVPLVEPRGAEKCGGGPEPGCIFPRPCALQSSSDGHKTVAV